MKPRCSCAVLVSGFGSNLQAILDASSKKNYPAEVSLVMSNNPQATALKRAQKKKIPTCVVNHKDYDSRESFDQELIRQLDQANIELVILAGFLRVLSPLFVNHFRGRIMNIHPSLLPAFPGIHSIEKAWQYGVKVTGVTIHFIDEGTDTGPIIFQEALTILPKENLSHLENRVHQIEYRLLPEAIQLFAEKRLEVLGRKVFIRSRERKK